jgi:hypothetical protein
MKNTTEGEPECPVFAFYFLSGLLRSFPFSLFNCALRVALCAPGGVGIDRPLDCAYCPVTFRRAVSVFGRGFCAGTGTAA